MQSRLKYKAAGDFAIEAYYCTVRSKITENAVVQDEFAISNSAIAEFEINRMKGGEHIACKETSKESCKETGCEEKVVRLK